MAPVPHTANHFAKSSDLPTDYDKEDDCLLSHDTTCPVNDSTSYDQQPLRIHVERVVRQYFALLGDETPSNLYDLILQQIEAPLLAVVLEQTRGNQTKCAQILGLNRGTLRKKLKTYDLM